MEASTVPAPSELSDEILARRAHCGDQRAFQQLHDRHSGRMRRIALAMLGSPADADDAVQEAWMRIYGRLSSMRGDSRPWINVIVRNEARRIGARRGRGDLPVEELPETRDPQNEPHAKIEVGERLRAITTTVSQMNDGDRATLALCAQGATPDYIAEALGVSAGTARVRTHRARRKVEARLVELDLAA